MMTRPPTLRRDVYLLCRRFLRRRRRDDDITRAANRLYGYGDPTPTTVGDWAHDLAVVTDWSSASRTSAPAMRRPGTRPPA